MAKAGQTHTNANSLRSSRAAQVGRVAVVSGFPHLEGALSIEERQVQFPIDRRARLFTLMPVHELLSSGMMRELRRSEVRVLEGFLFDYFLHHDPVWAYAIPGDKDRADILKRLIVPKWAEYCFAHYRIWGADSAAYEGSAGVDAVGLWLRPEDVFTESILELIKTAAELPIRMGLGNFRRYYGGYYFDDLLQDQID